MDHGQGDSLTHDIPGCVEIDMQTNCMPVFELGVSWCIIMFFSRVLNKFSLFEVKWQKRQYLLLYLLNSDEYIKL